MSIPTTGLSETSPAGSDIIALGDNKIREYKVQNREILEVDHVYPTSGQSVDAGKHKQISLLEQADLGTGTTGYCSLGAQTISGKPELVYTDEDDNDIQLTKGGVAYPSQSTVLADWSAIMNLVYPVGSVVTLGVSTNPATLFGIGTWTAIKGRVIVGIDAGQTEFDTLNETGGSKTHTLTTDEMPSHKHVVTGHNDVAGQSSIGAQSNGTGYTVKNDTSNTGGGQAHNNLQPYIVKYVWERTA